MTATEAEPTAEWDGELTAAKKLSLVGVQLDALADKAAKDAHNASARSLECAALNQPEAASQNATFAALHATYAAALRILAVKVSL